MSVFRFDRNSAPNQGQSERYMMGEINRQHFGFGGDLGIADKPTDGEFLSLVREMPVFDPGTIRMSAPKSSFAALLGKRFEEGQLARQIHRQIKGALEQALASYTRVLKEWIRRVTAQMGRQFDTNAERYRAQAEQAP
jgi:hypothetical protein